MKKLFLLLQLILCIVVFSSPVSGSTIFGPKTYTRSIGQTTVYTDTFQFSAGEALFTVENGSWNGEHRVDNQVSSATVSVNGIEIFRPSDFNQNVHLLETVLNLNSENTIVVELNGAPEGYLSISVFCQAETPSIALSAEQASIYTGEATTLEWNSTNAVSVSIEPAIGSVDLSGSISVSPLETTIYTISAVGPCETVTDQTTINVSDPPQPPTVLMSADPMTIYNGESAVLSWSSTNAETVSIDNGIGNVQVAGSLSVNPIVTTAYAISASGPGGTETATVIVEVLELNAEPTVTIIEPNNMQDIADAGFIIQWMDDAPVGNATVSLFYDVDNQGMDGKLIVAGINAELDGVGDEYFWDTSQISNGAFYVYAIIDDDVNEPVVAYSEYPVTVYHKSACLGAEKIVENYSKWLGYSGAMSGEYAIVGAPYSGSRYAYGKAYIYKNEAQGWVKKSELTPNDLKNHFTFGKSVAMDGDYAVVGADGEYSSYVTYVIGAAYVYKRDGENWVETAKLIPHDSSLRDKFGRTVAISGDYIFVGSLGNAFSVYVFKREGENWVEQTELFASDAVPGDQFGSSISISGDYAVIGAPSRDEEGVWNAGAVYVFKRDENGWHEQEKITLSNPKESDGFGSSLAIEGNTLIVGKGARNESGDDPYIAYVFKNDSTQWVEQARLSYKQKTSLMRSAHAVSISGDTAVIGIYDEENGSGAGAINVYKRYGDIWEDHLKITSCDGAPGNRFGTSVSISGDNIMVGAPHLYPLYDLNNGAIYFYDVPKVTVRIEADNEMIGFGESAILSWDSVNAESCVIIPDIGSVPPNGSVTITPSESIIYSIVAISPDGKATSNVKISVGPVKLKPARGVSLDRFGKAVAISENYAIIGADGGYSTLPGSAFIYKRDGYKWIEQAELKASDPNEEGEFGTVVDIDGDYAIVGAHKYENNSLIDSGAAYIFKREGESWAQHAKLLPDDNNQVDYFGNAVAISGEYAVVGAQGNKDDGYGGSVYVFKRKDDAWIEHTKLLPPDTDLVYNFGRSVSIDGDYVIVGSKNNNPYGGNAYIYKRDGWQWTRVARLEPSLESSVNYGDSVSINGDYAIVGDYNNNQYGENVSAYIYKREGESWAETARIPTSYHKDFAYSFRVSLYDDLAVIGSGYLDPEGLGNAGAAGDSDNGGGAGAAYIFPIPEVYVDLDAGPPITPTGEATLSWHSIQADSCFIEPEIGIVPCNGTLAISISDTTTYTIHASGPLGESTSSTTVTLGPVPPEAHITASSLILFGGESTTLSWNWSEGDTATIDNGIGEVPASGSLTVTPIETTIYTLSATGSGGIAKNSVTVLVLYPPDISITADPMDIMQGEPAYLSWSIEDAYTAEFTQSYGWSSIYVWSREARVYPTQTMIYTISAIGRGGSTTDSITVNVRPSPPEIVFFNAQPTKVVLGNRAWLGWEVKYATTTSIDNGIGIVPSYTRRDVLPLETTTYTLTASGPGGEVSSSVTIEVVSPPTASISATPSTIFNGESATLVWSASNVDTVTIEPGIGIITADSSTVIAPTQTTTYTITATNIAGTAQETVTVTSIDPNAFRVEIETPLDGEIIDRPNISVKGTIYNGGSDEIGVTVNSIPALVSGDQYIANRVILEEGENVITVQAEMADGSISDKSITVFYQPGGDYIRLISTMESGIAPFETSLIVRGNFGFAGAPTITDSGPGAVEYLPETEEDTFKVRMTIPGVYTFTVEAVDELGDPYTDSASVLVMDKAELDILLKAKWDGMKAALAGGDIETGLAHFVEKARDQYSGMFNALAVQLPQIVSEMQPIEMIYTEDNRAEYRINRIHDINGSPVIITYYIYFTLDEKGLWKIESF
ncbi:MAG: FG-GAP repeat protein [Proteobacteria bacterium]|nr:FG-GAP repeat protein [Pseudomonadota bacterium]MBU1709538.1 FG-GAP repeat protein [Pseudomonadota bacterium]